VRLSEPRSSAHQSIENSTQGIAINAAIDSDAVPATKINLDDARASPSTRWRRPYWRFSHILRRHR
jgi:hypothetical protein